MAELSKISFVPMPGGQVPPDPNVSGGMPPGGDPAAAGGAPPGGMPPGGMPPGDPSQQIDPAMMAQLMGGDPSGMNPGAPAAPQDPTAAGLDPSGGQPPMDPGTGQGPDIKKQIHEALVENGVVKPPKLKAEDQFAHIQTILESICGALGIQCPPMPVASNKPKSDGDSKPSSGGSSDSKSTPSKSAALKNALSRMRS